MDLLCSCNKIPNNKQCGVKEQHTEPMACQPPSCFMLCVFNGGFHHSVHNMDADVLHISSQFQAEERKESEGQMYPELHHMATLICMGVQKDIFSALPCLTKLRFC